MKICPIPKIQNLPKEYGNLVKCQINTQTCCQRLLKNFLSGEICQI